MLNILLIYYEPKPSGQTRHVQSLVHHLSRQRHRITLVMPDHLPQATFQHSGVEVIALPLGKIAWQPQSLIAVARLIWHRSIDIIHVHSQEAGLPMRVLAGLVGRPKLIYTPQTIDIRRTNWHWLYLQLERTLALVTDRIISVNEFDRQRLIRLGISPKKVVTIPNGIDLEAFGSSVDVKALRTRLGLASDPPLVIQVGRLSPQKDPLAFIDGAVKVIQTCPQAQFALIGQGPMKEAVQNYIWERGLIGQVHLLGWQAEAAQLIAAADVVTLTSRWEGLPYALLEAMAWSKPVVTTNVNGCPEVVVHNVTGFLTSPGDIHTWARYVTDLLTNSIKAQTMGKAGRKRVETHFSLKQMVEQTETLYSQVKNNS